MFVCSFIPSFLPSLLPSFLPSFLSSFSSSYSSFLPSFLSSFLPFFLPSFLHFVVVVDVVMVVVVVVVVMVVVVVVVVLVIVRSLLRLLSLSSLQKRERERTIFEPTRSFHAQTNLPRRFRLLVVNVVIFRNCREAQLWRPSAGLSSAVFGCSSYGGRQGGDPAGGTLNFGESFSTRVRALAKGGVASAEKSRSGRPKGMMGFKWQGM